MISVEYLWYTVDVVFIHQPSVLPVPIGEETRISPNTFYNYFQKFLDVLSCFFSSVYLKPFDV